MLHGTSESLEFVELLELLSARAKSGVLRLHHQGMDVSLCVREGSLCETAGHGDVRLPGTSTELTHTCSEVLQWRHFSFDFEPGATMPGAGDQRIPVPEVLALARAELAEWSAIEAVIPSLDSRPQPASEVGEEAVLLDAEQWRLLMAMDGKRTVEALVRTVGGTPISVCRRLRELIERNLVELVAQPAGPRTRIEVPTVAVQTLGEGGGPGENGPEPAPDPAPGASSKGD